MHGVPQMRGIHFPRVCRLESPRRRCWQPPPASRMSSHQRVPNGGRDACISWDGGTDRGTRLHPCGQVQAHVLPKAPSPSAATLGLAPGPGNLGGPRGSLNHGQERVHRRGTVLLLALAPIFLFTSPLPPSPPPLRFVLLLFSGRLRWTFTGFILGFSAFLTEVFKAVGVALSAGFEALPVFRSVGFS